MKRRIGDRRVRPRFEIVGDLWGSLETSTSFRIRNLGRGGAMLESPRPLRQESLQWMSAVIDGRPHPLQVRVRHVNRPDSDDEAPYLVGVEFVRMTPETDAFIVRVLADRGAGRGY